MIDVEKVLRELYDEELKAAARAAAEDMRERCAKAAEYVVPRHTECGNKIAAAIRALPLKEK